MISSWRKKKSSRASTKLTPSELVIPTHFRCPISLDLMKDPVTLSTGITYDRQSIDTWIEGGNKTCPLTKQVLTTLDTIPDHTLRRMIQDWGVANRSHGVERIPTPRVPVTSNEVADILGRFSKAQLGAKDCLELVKKVSKVVKESERNKRSFIANGACRTLALAFKSFAKEERQDINNELVISLLDELMSALVLLSPFDSESITHMGSSSSLTRLFWFLKRGSLNAILILKELVSKSKDQDTIVKELKYSNIEAALVDFVRDPVCPASTKAALVVIYKMIIPSTTARATEPIISKFVDSGLVHLLVEMLVEAEDKNTCEKALVVLDELCRSNVGIKATFDHSLTVPVLVKKIHRVSDLATEFSVSVLWRMSQKEDRDDGGVLVEALQVGAFQKLLLILQVGYNFNGRTKEKVTQLLKLLNLYRDKVECIESMDFKQIKRSF